jgi:hypothetical protein
MNIPSGFQNGIPQKKGAKQDDMDKRAYRLGYTAANQQVMKANLEQEKASLEQDKAQFMQAIIAMNLQQQQAQQQAQYAGAHAATQQHLDGYSNSLAQMLGTGPEAQQGMPQQNPQQQPQQQQPMQ